MELRAKGQANAADYLERDGEDFLTFYDFPEEHWLHLRTSNPIWVIRPWGTDMARAA